MTLESSQEQQKKTSTKNKWILVLIISILVGPFILTPLLVDPYTLERNAHGTLLIKPINLGNLDLKTSTENTDNKTNTKPLSQLDDNWKLFYIMPDPCDQACNFSLLQMERVRRSMDRLINKVTLLVASTSKLSNSLEQKASSEFKEITFTQISKDQIYEGVKVGHIYLMSPNGHLVVKYEAHDDEREAILYAKGIRKDLRKSIKGDRH
jgi:hypothetical protein